MSAAIYRTGSREFRFNDLVVVEMLFGVPDERRIGRLVQVRKGTGAFCSDKLFIRLRDGSLACYENVLVRHAYDKQFEDAFYRSNGRTPPVIQDQPPFEGDGEDVTYLIADKYPEVGFVIEHPSEPDSPVQSFAIRIEGGRV